MRCKPDSIFWWCLKSALNLSVVGQFGILLVATLDPVAHHPDPPDNTQREYKDQAKAEHQAAH